MSNYEEKVQIYFPNAKPIKNVTSTIVTKIENEQKILKEQILLATSVCSDEVNHNKYSFSHQFKNGEFMLGGITGFPFSGETGLAAYLSHIPDDGALLIIYGPHIGISKKGTVGSIFRNMQTIETATCGALCGILESFNTNTDFSKKQINSSDYQVDFMAQKLHENIEKIKATDNPIIEITKQSYSLIEDNLQKILASKNEIMKDLPVYLLGGILINTDDGYDDYFEEIVFRKFK